jgi:hypothetical protein
MPVILDPDNYDLWLDPGMNDVPEIARLLRPYNAESMRCYPITHNLARTEALCRSSEKARIGAYRLEAYGTFCGTPRHVRHRRERALTDWIT